MLGGNWIFCLPFVLTSDFYASLRLRNALGTFLFALSAVVAILLLVRVTFFSLSWLLSDVLLAAVVDSDTSFSLSVSFPSDALLRCLRKLNLLLYLDLFGGLGNYSVLVVLVRGREDTEGDGDAGVKVQGDWSRGVPS